MGPLYVGQVPAKPAVFTVVDEYEKTLNLSDYASVAFLLVGPDGDTVDTSAGSASIADASKGQVQYAWPSTSLFTRPGEYQYQLVLRSAGGAHDLTTVGEIPVRRSLEGTS